ncbi:MAG TPA: NAD+ synthase [Anaerolineae bacterium]
MKVTMAQLDPTIGDFDGNLAKMQRVLAESAAEGPDLVVFSELYLSGYPPQDLLERGWFIDRGLKALDEVLALSRHYPQTAIIVGLPLSTNQPAGKGLYNSAVMVCDGEVIFQQNKTLLPTYDVFDEARYFDPSPNVSVFPFRDERLGISICEDAWNDPALWLRVPYHEDPIALLAEAGATLMINISASPFWAGKEAVRYRLLAGHARRHHIPLIFVNQIGANDELIFDGRSLYLDAEGRPVCVLPAFAEQVTTIDTKTGCGAEIYAPQERIAAIHDALLLGIRGYLAKTGFKQAVIGLSGGIDSAVTCALAAEALGPENVHGVAMPSRYSSEGSVSDAAALARNLGIDYRVIAIAGPFEAYLRMLEPAFAGKTPDITEENIQARIRGNILMALSNKFGYLVLTTGNKSELAVGYCTLYGDMSGGLSVIADVPKTVVYQLAAYINRSREIIPAASITKPPSAELRPNQTDQDTLPPYEVLDAVLQLYVDEGKSVAEITAHGFDPEMVGWVVRTVNRSEYKRWQAAPVLKVTSKAFGLGRRMPIAARYPA